MEIDDIKIRRETREDWYEVENLTREAFWDLYHPGCLEHFLLHQFRTHPDFIEELDLVIELKERIVAHIMYSRAEIKSENGTVIPIVTFGPVSVLPLLQGQGIGSALINYSMEEARKLGYVAIAIIGNPGFYHRFGFVSGSSLNIIYASASKGDEAPYFMVKELKKGALSRIKGTYQDPEGYHVKDEDVEEFDRKFPPKEKHVFSWQLN